MADTAQARTMRITTGGNVSAYAHAALTLLSPVVLHTRPLAEPLASATDAPGASSSKRKGTLQQSTLAAPRLVSVVEKVKREYPGGALWQYTESGLLSPVAEERPSLERVLEGKTKPKMTHHPYLQITLSTRPLGLEKQRNVTCQRATGPQTKGKATDPADEAQLRSKKERNLTGGKEPSTGSAAPPQASSETLSAGQPPQGKRKSDVGQGGPSKRVRM